MTNKKKTVKSDEIVEQESVIINENDIIPEEKAETLKSDEIIEAKVPEVVIEKEKKAKKSVESTEKTPKYKIGSIVYVSKDAEADLNGFKLFPQYKKYTYTVEAYDAISDVYSLRRLNLSLRLKEVDIVAPHERAHDSINRRQF